MEKENDKRLKQITQEKNIIFNEFEMKIDNNPIILFTDWYGDLYYLKTRSSYDKQGLKKDKTKYELEIPASAMKEKTLIVKDLYIDTARIYKIKEKEFDLIYNNEKIPLVSHLNWEYGRMVFEEVLANFEKQPPEISLIEVFFNEESNNFNHSVLFTNSRVLEQERKLLATKKIKIDNFYEKAKILVGKSNNENTFKILDEIKGNINSEFRDYSFNSFYDEEEQNKIDISFNDLDFIKFTSLTNLYIDNFRLKFNQKLETFDEYEEKEEYVSSIRKIEFYLPKELEMKEIADLLVLVVDDKIKLEEIKRLGDVIFKRNINEINDIINSFADKYLGFVEAE
ncbi:Mbov_0400 family ICE element protein [Mycoplasma procyoni]|uniref:Mbov_0400 family ICE element protein n=1 Tax=Mycoplasma procyoni TaxID=568784 RepID=UPI00197C098A|nr:hypothetical protein [Mycoplasma procyoni]MBN3534670.1 hypothetical protein [Mycoplasma procyoni]